MKKYFNISICALFALSLVFYSSCSENSEFDTLEETQNKTIFEDLSLKDNISPNFWDNHFYLIEQLGNNFEREKIIDVLIENNITLNSIDADNVKKLYSNNSEILMYSVSIKNSEDKIIVYKYDNIYQINKTEFSSLNNGKRFKLTSLDNELFYSFQLNELNEIGKVKIEDNSILNKFSNDVYELHINKHGSLISNALDGKEDCCRHAAGWSACMDCTVSACGSSWGCAITFALLPAEMAAGFALSCIGAGPNTFC